jgi:hypothetical protein
VNIERAKLIVADRENHADDASFIEVSNLRTYTRRHNVCGYGTVRTILGKTVADGIAAFLAAVDPIPGQMFIAGNVDMGLPETWSMIDALASQGIVTIEQAEVLRDLGRVADPLPCEMYGVAEMTSEALAEARSAVELDAGYDAIAELQRAQWNARCAALGTMQAAGTPAPKTLSELDEVM